MRLNAQPSESGGALVSLQRTIELTQNTSAGLFLTSNMRMKSHLPASLLIVAFTLSGCASNEPSAEMRAWARQQIAEKQRFEAAQIAHAQEVARLKAENERIKAQADAERRQAEAATWVAQNKKTVMADLTKGFEPHMQSLLENYGIEGKALVVFAEDVEMRGNVFYTLIGMVWQNRDGTGGVARVLGGQDLVADKTVCDKVVEKKLLTQKELSAMFRGDSAKEIMNVGTAAKQPSAWTPTNETVNSGYQAAIKIAATAAGIAVVNMLSGN